MIIDTHAHTNFLDFKDDYKDVIQRALDDGVWMINASSNLENAMKAVHLANHYKEGVFAAVGQHPIHEGGGDVDYDTFEKLARDPKTVAIGEVGLDYFHMKQGTKEGQHAMLRRFIDIACSVDKPAIIHCRNAYEDLLKVLHEAKRQHPHFSCVMHFFAGSKEVLREVLDMGFYVSFTGVITFAREYDERIRMVPDDRIMAETDCPFVAPEPFRGKRNEPLYVKQVIQKMADVRGVSFDDMARITTKNAKRFFRI
jgi:TatD DNase family protein